MASGRREKRKEKKIPTIFFTILNTKICTRTSVLPKNLSSPPFLTRRAAKRHTKMNAFAILPSSRLLHTAFAQPLI